jgi:hypothetical protein
MVLTPRQVFRAAALQPGMSIELTPGSWLALKGYLDRSAESIPCEDQHAYQLRKDRKLSNLIESLASQSCCS